MIQSHEALKKSLEALEACATYFDKYDDHDLVKIVDDAITDARVALSVDA